MKGGTFYFPIDYVKSPEFGETGLLLKIFIIYFSGFFIRVKYYTGWFLSHSAMSFSGLTYGQIVNEKSEIVHHFNKASCFDFYGVEIEPNIKKKLTVHKLIIYFRNGI